MPNSTETAPISIRVSSVIFAKINQVSKASTDVQSLNED